MLRYKIRRKIWFLTEKSSRESCIRHKFIPAIAGTVNPVYRHAHPFAEYRSHCCHKASGALLLTRPGHGWLMCPIVKNSLISQWLHPSPLMHIDRTLLSACMYARGRESAADYTFSPPSSTVCVVYACMYMRLGVNFSHQRAPRVIIDGSNSLDSPATPPRGLWFREGETAIERETRNPPRTDMEKVRSRKCVSDYFRQSWFHWHWNISDSLIAHNLKKRLKILEMWHAQFWDVKV